MSDETNDDAPDIPPALTPEQWTRGAFVRGSFVDGAYKMPGAQIALRTEGESTRLIVAKDGATIVFEDVAELAAVIALANDALRRFDDPRAITRADVEMQRSAADIIEDRPVDDAITRLCDDDLASRLHERADALDSLLPPPVERGPAYVEGTIALDNNTAES